MARETKAEREKRERNHMDNLDGVGSVVPQLLTVVRTLDQGGLRSADGRIDLDVVSGLGVDILGADSQREAELTAEPVALVIAVAAPEAEGNCAGGRVQRACA